MSVLDQAKEFLRQRAASYRTVFRGYDEMDAPATHDVMFDLRTFCRAEKSTFHPDPRVAAQLDGRREVYLRIMDHLNLSEDELWAKYKNKHLPKE